MTRLKGKEVFDVMEMDRPTTFTEKNRSIRLPRLLAALLLLIFVFSLFVCVFLFYKNIECYEDGRRSASLTSSVRHHWSDIVESYSDYRKISSSSSSGSSIDLRLPRSVIPDSYSIEIIPFVWEGNFTFNGFASIVVNVTGHTKNITLHAHKLNVSSSDLSAYRLPLAIANEVLKPDEPLRIADIANDTRRQFLIVQFSDYLQPEYQYRLNIRYVGYLNDNLEGFYRSSYKAGNKKRWIAATQFQATDARQAFPCFDEPSMKAKFTLKIGRPRHMNTLSNMPVSKHSVPIEGIPNYVMDHYRESVPMSTYLVAFVVTDFSELSDGRFHVWAREDAIEQTRYAMSIGPKILTFYEHYFGIPFPLPKIDMIALPDFSSGAMENWGLITYRETTMLYENGVSTRYNKENVASVIAHELAHQWFGNLVTPEWWSDLWLNEGFATYIEYVGTDAIEPSWRVLEQFVVEELHSVLSLDALLSSHPISVQVNDPDEINEIFDGISYNKGAAIIRMMDHFLTKAVFKRGVNNYLKSKSFQCATQDDLWEALTVQAHRDGVLDQRVTIKQIMDTWTLQTGFPVVTVIRDYSTSAIIVLQSRFTLNLERKPDNEDKTLWWIPLTYTTQATSNFENTQPTHWLKAEEKIIIDNIRIKPDHWLLFNVKETGYYRVNYDNKNWQLLIQTLNDPDQYHTIEPLNRAQLINDALRLAHAGLLNYTIALDVTQYLQHEVEYIPWRAAFNDLEYIDNMLHKTVSYNKYKAYVLHLLLKLYESTGFAEKSTDDQLMIYRRVEVLNQACHLGYDDCLRKALNQFQNWKHNPQPDTNNPISPNLKGIVYCTAIRIGGQNEWEFAWRRYLKSNVASEKDIILMALGCSREPWILSRYLEWSLDENSGIKKQDMGRVFRSVSTNVIGQPLAWAIIRDQWERIVSYLGTSLFGLNSIIKATFRNVNTEYELKELIKFAATHRNNTGPANRAIAQAIERAESNVKWMKINYKTIVSWLDEKVSALPTFDNVI